jgi:hypothetical protein
MIAISSFEGPMLMQKICSVTTGWGSEPAWQERVYPQAGR